MCCVVKAELTHPRVTDLGSDTQGSWAEIAGLLIKTKRQLRCSCDRCLGGFDRPRGEMSMAPKSQEMKESNKHLISLSASFFDLY